VRRSNKVFSSASNKAGSVKHNVCLHHTLAMPCDEAIRLRREYDTALMRWGKTLFLARHESDIESKAKADQLRLAALNARNEAIRRLVTHNQSCPVCRRDKIKLV
jgi:hypothetical protein